MCLSFLLLFVLSKSESVSERTCLQYASSKARSQGSAVLKIVPFLRDNMSLRKGQKSGQASLPSPA
jgi:hypothetical protein